MGIFMPGGGASNLKRDPNNSTKICTIAVEKIKDLPLLVHVRQLAYTGSSFDVHALW